jgi:hypothetical protein
LSPPVHFNSLLAMSLPANEPSAASLSRLLSAMKPAVLAADREWQKVSANEAPTFRALSVVSPDENRISDVIAELLNPHGTHGQKTTFLTLFCQRSQGRRRTLFCVMTDEALRVLKRHGRKVIRLEVGLPEWKAAGVPVEVGEAFST